MKGIWESIVNFVDQTKVVEQVKEVDAQGLFTNPWFIVPFVLVIGYMVFKTAWRDLAVIAILFGVWYATGTPYMQTLVVGNELSMDKILPVVFGGAIVLGVLIYLLFNRSD